MLVWGPGASPIEPGKARLHLEPQRRNNDED